MRAPHLSRRVTGGAFESGPFVDGANALVCHGEDRATRADCGSIWSQTFSFDAFGNINKAGNSSFSASYSPSTNRMTTIGSSTPTYDANGNVTNDFLHTYAWDAEGHPVTIDGIGATYDALGRMVEQNRSGTYTEIAYAPTGEKIALLSGQTLQRAFVSLPGGATAVYSSSGLDHYRHSDWLGSARLSTTPSRTVYGDVAYAPYGETYAASGNTDFSWTGINADVEPANPETLYDFPAREYGIQGRWPSPDPLGLGAVNLGNPQSWNRYAYVLNNPLALTDPTGLIPGEPSCDNDSCDPCMWNFLACLDPCLFAGDCAFPWRPGSAPPPPPPPPPPPQAAPAPPGGYGAGIDPYGTWDEKLPSGVQVFPGPLGSTGAGCTYGSGNCGGMIYGWTKDAAGNIIGDFPGEELCTLGPLGTCLYWNLSARKWQQQDNATKLANAVNKTGVQSLANPCTLAAWYLASAGAAVTFSATSSGAAAFPVTHGALQSLAGWYLAADEEIQAAVQGAATAGAWLGYQAVQGCNALQ